MAYVNRSWAKAFRTLRHAVFLAAFVQAISYATEATSVTQYGITWTFDKPHTVGQFINGDYWVAGPVTVVSVTPAPCAAPSTEPGTSAKSIYGATSLVADKRMRNGSMIGAVNSNQGYDSRSPNYDPALSVAFPCSLNVNRSLISTISEETYNSKGELATPFLLGQQGFFLCGKTLPLALNTAAVLTCLEKAPPADAFRPPYVGIEKPIFQAKDIRWDILPKLKSVPSTPDWKKMERVFERPWLDGMPNWLGQYMLPGENQPNYGREFARMTSIAAAMMLLDVPKEKKEKLLLSYVQLGIDLYGVAKCGRQWFSDGGHWQGRKWPILFASLMLGSNQLRTLPIVQPESTVYGGLKYAPTAGDPPTTTLFQEDLDTYYGTGADGQTALWQMVTHTGLKQPYQEKPSANWDAMDKKSEAYRSLNSNCWPGTALAAQMMNARALWDHDAFFDYVDQWMGPNEKCETPKWFPAGCRKCVDLFLEEMWNTYRSQVPAQPCGKDNLKWVWTNGSSGHWVQNPKPAKP